MRNIKLTIAYDGSGFHGWQFQPGVPTIQGALDAAARKITQERIIVQGASRTDTGVHALGQVAHFRTQSALTPDEFQRALNALIPPAIRVVEAEEVGPEFHARWLAQAKTYRYRIYRGRVLLPSSTAARCIFPGRSTKAQWRPLRESLKASTTSLHLPLRLARKRMTATAS